jgi:thymidylate synthase
MKNLRDTIPAYFEGLNSVDKTELTKPNTYISIHEAYLTTLADVYDNPDHIATPRGQRTREKLNYQFTILSPKPEPIVTADADRNEVIASYTAKEVALYDSKTNSAEDFGKASKFWLSLANPDGTVNSAYGHLIWDKKSHGNDFETELKLKPGFDSVFEHVPVRRTPWEWAQMCLVKDKDTRQAILRFSLPEHAFKGVLDFTCTLHGIFLIRDNKLNFSVNMRSNDLWLGLTYDLPWFISLMYKMQADLKEVYPDLEIGTYTHYVHSLHIYDRNEEAILKALGRTK